MCWDGASKPLTASTQADVHIQRMLSYLAPVEPFNCFSVARLSGQTVANPSAFIELALSSPWQVNGKQVWQQCERCSRSKPSVFALFILSDWNSYRAAFLLQRNTTNAFHCLISFFRFVPKVREIRLLLLAVTIRWLFERAGRKPPILGSATVPGPAFFGSSKDLNERKTCFVSQQSWLRTEKRLLSGIPAVQKIMIQICNNVFRHKHTDSFHDSAWFHSHSGKDVDTCGALAVSSRTGTSRPHITLHPAQNRKQWQNISFTMSTFPHEIIKNAA